MTSIARRTVEELVARYELEPELNDIYVEGLFDEDLLTSAYGANIGDRSIYTIETVEIPGVLLAQYGYTLGNKQRILALAKELEKLLSQNYSYICLTDLDLDGWFPPNETIKNHKTTKYTSLEVCFFHKDYLRHHLCIVCRAKINDFDGLFDDIAEILSKLFAVRCADKYLNLNVSWIDFEKCLENKNGRLILKLEDFLRRSLNKSKLNESLDDVIENACIWEKKFDGDPRRFIRGHDFVRMLAWIVKNYGGVKDVSTESANYRLLVSAAANNREIGEELNIISA